MINTETKERRTSNHSVYGGEINLEDFDTNKPNKKRIENQASADKLHETVNKAVNKKKEEEKYKHMTLEELKEIRIISNTNGRPSPTLTDEKWQKEFNVRKMFVKPFKFGVGITRLGGRYSKESGKWNEELQGRYDGCTNWQSYCIYINDVLKNIECRQIDYVYYIYQILDLLRFHYEDLRTRYCDGYWEVWLDK